MTMAAGTSSKIEKSRRNGNGDAGTRFDRRLEKILTHATDIFYDKGYEGASMRDLSRTSGMSLAGLYYYFNSKERLLYQIQKHTFTTIVERLRERLEHEHDSEKRVRLFILNHLEYSVAHPKAMKVLSHEDEVLKDGPGAEIAAIKREYYRICLNLLEHFKRAKRLEFSSRVAVMSLFGMMNWIYTWYKAKVDPDAHELAEEMGDIFLKGIGGRDAGRSSRNKSRASTGLQKG
jgi:TetR/AcrR family transcriptional regulator, cholesterol catabolism regulator